jgi:hypothetical protein
MNDLLFSTYTLGDLELSNRMVMAPMTRNRASEGAVPTDMNVTYYRQRASAGLIITEASQVSPEGVGYPATPGMSRSLPGARSPMPYTRKGATYLSSSGIAAVFRTPACYRMNKPRLHLPRSNPKAKLSR